MSELPKCEHCKCAMRPPAVKEEQEAIARGFDPDGDNVLLCDDCYVMIMAKWKVMQS